MKLFIKRNLLVFFRDKAAVFYSLLSSLIIIGLYALFLGNNMASYMDTMPNARILVDRWLVAGLVSITSISSAMGAYGVMVEDKAKRIIQDFYTSPIRRWKLIGGYVSAAFVIGVIMSLITLLVAQLYMLAQGGTLMTALEYLETTGIILLGAFTNTSMVFFFAYFFKTESAFGTASTLLGTLIGFVTGIYIPIGVLPESVQWVIKLFPTSHAVVLLRQVMTDSFFAPYAAVLSDATLLDIKKELGIVYFFGDKQVPAVFSLLFLTGVGVFFFLLSLLHVKRKQK
ncbi:MAG: ABC transporter permease [Firmicutes bacterium]|nr:ABC transporter permease [Bacillota bacterium]